MLKNAHDALPVSNAWEDRRRLPRKTTRLYAVIAGTSGENAFECAILDINAAGAQISFSKTLPIGAEVSLLNSSNQLAHLAKVMWSKSRQSGLSFLQTHTMGAGLPPHLSFLLKLWLAAKLRKIDRDLARGVAVHLAFLNAALSEVDLHYMSQRAKGDIQFEHALIYAKRLLSPSAVRSEA